MPFCTNCGAKTGDGALFCGNCGNKIAGEEERFAAPAADLGTAGGVGDNAGNDAGGDAECENILDDRRSFNQAVPRFRPKKFTVASLSPVSVAIAAGAGFLLSIVLSVDIVLPFSLLLTIIIIAIFIIIWFIMSISDSSKTNPIPIVIAAGAGGLLSIALPEDIIIQFSVFLVGCAIVISAIFWLIQSIFGGAKTKFHAVGVIAGVLGIAGLVAWMALLQDDESPDGIFRINTGLMISGILGLILGLVNKNKGFAIAGVIHSIIGLLLAIFCDWYFFGGGRDVGDVYDMISPDDFYSEYDFDAD
jgi:hypothetical protein